jgi:hypothetical protein
VGIDAARKGQKVTTVKGLFCLLGQEIMRKTIDLAVFDANVERIDRSLIRTSDTNIFYDEIEQFRHRAFLVSQCMLVTAAQALLYAEWTDYAS